MSLQHLPIDQIKEADLQRLIADGTRESRYIDYKRDWQLVSDADRKEFLADVASFANAGGGDLVYGIDAKDGVPINLVGLNGFAHDSEQLKVEQLLARWIAPRLGGVAFATVLLASSKPVFLIRVPRSWSAPHMVTFNDVNRFHSRHSNGKYQLDVNELRAAFLNTAQAGNRLRDFRLERVSRIAAGDLTVKLVTKYCVVLHLMPFAEWSEYDYTKVAQKVTNHLSPMGGVSSWGDQPNFDGCMVKSTANDGAVQSYVQVFRNGCLEAVLTSPGAERAKQISPGYEQRVQEGMIRYLGALKTLGVMPPYAVALSLLNVGGFTMAVSADYWDSTPVRIDRPHLLLPEVLIERADQPLEGVLTAAFDMVWNACGYRGGPRKPR